MRERRHDSHSRHPHIKQEPEDRGYERSSFRENRSGERQQQERERRVHDDRRRQRRRENQGNNPFQSSNDQNQYGTDSGAEASQSQEPKDKDKPNFELSGKLTEDTNTYRGVVIKYNEPPEARKPKKKWRWYPFKDDQPLPILHLHRQSAFLLGRDRRVADIPVDHPSCSKQHAVLQFRLVPFERPDGTTGRQVRPYIIDLGSANGTYINNKRIDSERYVQLYEKDMVKFGFSSREYVLLHDKTHNCMTF